MDSHDSLNYHLRVLSKSFPHIKTLLILMLLILGPMFLYSFLSKSSEVAGRVMTYRDLTQDYLMGRALNDGRNPYQSLSKLSATYLPNVEYCSQLEYSPHTPFSTVLFSYLAAFKFQTFNVIWNAVSVIALAAGIFLLAPGITFLFYFLSLYFSEPVQLDLMYGQINSFLFFLFALSFFFYRRDMKAACGIILGVLFALKYSSVILLVYFLIRRDFKVIYSAAISCLVAMAVTLTRFEPEWLHSYFTVASPHALKYWVTNVGSFSIYSQIHKALYPRFLIKEAGACTLTLVNQSFEAPFQWLAGLAAVLVVGVGLIKNLKHRLSLNTFANLLALSLLAYPLSWIHYWTLLIPKFISFRFTGRVSARTVLLPAILAFLFYYPIYETVYIHYLDPLSGYYRVSYQRIIFSMLPSLLIFLLSLDRGPAERSESAEQR